MKYLRFALLIIAIGLTAIRVTAQDEVFISLNMETTTLQTGEFYEVQITVENVVDLWVTDVEIDYDPNQLYIIGTASGSPVRPGPLQTSETIIPRNRINADVLQYTVSLLNPAPPINGTGVIGTFVIYPLQAGETQLTFRRASLTRVSFEGTGAERTPQEPQSLAFTPVLLQLSAVGETVPIPAEETATPPPTNTPVEDTTGPVVEATRPVQSTLENITRVPVTPTPAGQAGEQTPANNTLLTGIVILLIVTGIGLLILLVIYMRRYRR